MPGYSSFIKDGWSCHAHFSNMATKKHGPNTLLGTQPQQNKRKSNLVQLVAQQKPCTKWIHTNQET